MKYQQVSVDFVNMTFTAFTYVALAGAVWVFLRLLQACFSLPRHLKRQNDIQQMLQDKVDSYEKYIEECEAKEREAAESGEPITTVGENGEESTEIPVIDEAKWKERRECLEMLKKELRRVRDGGEDYDWDYLLKDDEEEEKKDNDEEKEKDASEDKDGDKEKTDEETFSDLDEAKPQSKTKLNSKIVEEKEDEEVPEEAKKNN